MRGLRAATLALLFLPAHAAAAGGEPGKGPELAAKVLELRRSASVRARGRMSVTAGRQPKVYQIAIVQKRIGRTVHLLWMVTDPPDARLRVLVESPERGEAVVRTAAGVVPPRRWTEPILGSHLSFEDLTEDYFSWPAQTATGEEPAGGKACVVIRSEPGTRASSFVSITTWLDPRTLVPMRIVKQARGGAAKEIVCRGVRQTGGRWAASTVEIRRPGAAGLTRIAFTGGSETARVKDSEVDPAVVFAAEGR